MAMTAREKKAKQRQRDKLAGLVVVSVKVDPQYAQAIKDYAASFPPPAGPTDPDQLSLLDRIDAELASGDTSPDDDQGSLF
jgi:hypothetical protein